MDILNWGYGFDGTIRTDPSIVQFYKPFGYLLIHIPTARAFFRKHLFVSETVFKWCIERWNEQSSDWLHIPLEDIDGWKNIE